MLRSTIHEKGEPIAPISFSYPYKEYPKEGVDEHSIITHYKTIGRYNSDLGDQYDTSPFQKEGVMGISTNVYVPT